MADIAKGYEKKPHRDARMRVERPTFSRSEIMFSHAYQIKI